MMSYSCDDPDCMCCQQRESREQMLRKELEQARLQKRQLAARIHQQQLESASLRRVGQSFVSYVEAMYGLCQSVRFPRDTDRHWESQKRLHVWREAIDRFRQALTEGNDDQSQMPTES